MSLNTLTAITTDITKTLHAEISLSQRGIKEYRVDVPFYFADGDALKIILRETSDNEWLLTDEGHTLMHLSYNDIEIDDGATRRSLFDKIILSHFMENADGRLTMPRIPSDGVGPAVFTFAQGLMKVADMAMWRREHVKSMFMDDFKKTIPRAVGNRIYHLNYSDPHIDPAANYPIDCLVEGANGLKFHIYIANSNDKAQESTISMLYYTTRGVKNPNCVVFDSTSNLSKKNRDRVSDTADKTLSSLDAVPEFLPAFIEKCEAISS